MIKSLLILLSLCSLSIAENISTSTASWTGILVIDRNHVQIWSPISAAIDGTHLGIRARNLGTTANVGKKYYFISGVGDPSVQMFDLTTGVTVDVAPLPIARSEASTTWFANSFMLCAGEGDESCQFYNEAANQWQPMNVSIQDWGVIMSTFGDDTFVMREEFMYKYNKPAETWDQLPTRIPIAMGWYPAGVYLSATTFIVCGGSGGNTASITNQCWIYDHTTSVWTQTHSMVVKRCMFAMATFQGRLYALGGASTYLTEDGTGSDLISSVEVYDPQHGWSLMPNGLKYPSFGLTTIAVSPGGTRPTTLKYPSIVVAGAAGAEAVNPQLRENAVSISALGSRGFGYMSVSVFNGVVYMMGGKTNGGSVTNQVSAFTIASRQLAQVESLPFTRYALCSTALPSSIVACGGFNAPNSVKADCAQFVSGHWRTINSYPIAIAHAQMVTLIDRPYVFGGVQNNGQLTDAVNTYDSGSYWLNKQTMPVEAYAQGAVATSLDTALLCGGIVDKHNTMSVDCYVYNARLDTFTATKPLTQPRAYHSLVKFNDLIYCIGGVTGSSPSGERSIEQFNTALGWTVLSQSKLISGDPTSIGFVIQAQE